MIMSTSPGSARLVSSEVRQRLRNDQFQHGRGRESSVRVVGEDWKRCHMLVDGRNLKPVTPSLQLGEARGVAKSVFTMSSPLHMCCQYTSCIQTMILRVLQ
jgi:hypothetical protein